MVTYHILKRKDASSVVVAIVLAFIINQLLSVLTHELAYKLSMADDGYGSMSGVGWQTAYLQPLISVVLQVLALELLLIGYVYVSGKLRGK